MKGVCSSCRKQKYEVHASKSTIVPNIDLLMCNMCIKKGYEPRHIIILAARSGKLALVTPFIIEQRYVGDKIHAADILRDR
jgi:hypothetical protein